MEYKEINSCLVCGNYNLVLHCDIGKIPLVNNLKNNPIDEDKLFPLIVNECPLCSHKQLSIAVDPNILFSNYIYQTGFSKSHIDFLKSFADSLSDGSVLDIGCNDGTFLSLCKTKDRTGIEPSERLAEKAFHVSDSHIIRDFFPSKIMKERFPHKKFHNIVAFNVFAHNDNPKEFLIEMSNLLEENGRIYILTTPSRIDNYYHEHISYFTYQSMMRLARECSCELVSFKEVSMHGESSLFEIKKLDKKQYDEMMKRHIKYVYDDFSDFRNKENRLVAYGASASETMLFNYLNIIPEYVVDDNPLKQGKYIPGINSPIVSSQHLATDIRDLTIIVAHHLFDEIVEKIKVLRPNHKDRFERLL